MLPVLNVSPISRPNKWSSIHGKRPDSELFFLTLHVGSCASSAPLPGWCTWERQELESESAKQLPFQFSLTVFFFGGCSRGQEHALGSEKVVLHFCMILCS